MYNALFTLDNLSTKILEIHKKKYSLMFLKNIGLSITIGNEHNSVNFQNVNLDLEIGIYKPYHKLNTQLQYVSVNNNHPRSITHGLVENISKILSKLSTNK